MHEHWSGTHLLPLTVVMLKWIFIMSARRPVMAVRSQTNILDRVCIYSPSPAWAPWTLLNICRWICRRRPFVNKVTKVSGGSRETARLAMKNDATIPPTPLNCFNPFPYMGKIIVKVPVVLFKCSNIQGRVFNTEVPPWPSNTLLREIIIIG